MCQDLITGSRSKNYADNTEWKPVNTFVGAVCGIATSPVINVQLTKIKTFAAIFSIPEYFSTKTGWCKSIFSVVIFLALLKVKESKGSNEQDQEESLCEELGRERKGRGLLCSGWDSPSHLHDVGGVRVLSRRGRDQAGWGGRGTGNALCCNAVKLWGEKNVKRKHMPWSKWNRNCGTERWIYILSSLQSHKPEGKMNPC